MGISQAYTLFVNKFEKATDLPTILFCGKLQLENFMHKLINTSVVNK